MRAPGFDADVADHADRALSKPAANPIEAFRAALDYDLVEIAAAKIKQIADLERYARRSDRQRGDFGQALACQICRRDDGEIDPLRRRLTQLESQPAHGANSFSR